MDKKKKALLVLFMGIVGVLIIAVVIFALNTNKMTLSVGRIVHVNEFENISMSVSNVTNTSITYTIQNNSEEDVTYGEEYEIEKSIDDQWYRYNIAISFVEVANILPKGGTAVNDINFLNTYGKLPKGKYRLIKKIQEKTFAVVFNIE